MKGRVNKSKKRVFIAIVYNIKEELFSVFYLDGCSLQDISLKMKLGKNFDLLVKQIGFRCMGRAEVSFAG